MAHDFLISKGRAVDLIAERTILSLNPETENRTQSVISPIRPKEALDVCVFLLLMTLSMQETVACGQMYK